MNTAVSFIIGLLFLAGSAAAQTTIALRPQASLGGQSVIHLSDIADISGDTPDAARLGEVVVSADGAREAGADGVLDVSVADVRRALEALGGVNWGRVALSGGTCAVRIGSPIARTSPPAKPFVAHSTKSLPGPIEIEGPQTIRTMLGSRLAEHYGVEIADLRLAFDDADESVLSTSVEGKRVDIQPGAGPGTARLPVNVFLYDGDRIVLSRLVTVSAQIRRQVATATHILERGQAITEDVVSVGPQWVSPGGKAFAGTEQLSGALAASRIPAGQPVYQSDLTTPVIVKRGEIVYVHAVNGNVVVKAKARAMGSARDGEMVQLKLDGSDQVFSARMSGRGRAVMVVSDPDSDEADQPISRVFGASASPKGAKPSANSKGTSR